MGTGVNVGVAVGVLDGVGVKVAVAGVVGLGVMVDLRVGFAGSDRVDSTSAVAETSF